MADEILPLTKNCRKGKSRKRFERMDGAVVDGKLRFKSKVAIRNYEMTMGECFPSDMWLMDFAFVRCQKDTREYRRQRKTGEMMFRGKPHCYKSEWLRLRINFDGDECLFFPSFVINRPEKVRYNYKNMAAARAMLLMTQGLPKDSSKNLATHKCGHGHLSCVNPEHLAWGDIRSNARDRTSHNAARQFVSGMDPEDIERIRTDRRLCNVISLEAGIPASVINGIKTGELWAGPTA